MSMRAVATIQLPDPDEERDGVFFDLTGLAALKALPAGTKLYIKEDDEDYDGIIEYWWVEPFGETSALFHGLIFSDRKGRFPDGYAMHTSEVRDFHDKRKGDIIVTRNSKYKLGRSRSGLDTYQQRVEVWCRMCFGDDYDETLVTRAKRLLEEAIELAQALDLPRTTAKTLVDFVYDRPVGEDVQEVGGVMVTLAALCAAAGYNMQDCGEMELKRVWNNMDAVRLKNQQKRRELAERGIADKEGGG